MVSAFLQTFLNSKKKAVIIKNIKTVIVSSINLGRDVRYFCIKVYFSIDKTVFSKFLFIKFSLFKI